jgi:hypothetical protein
VFGLGVLITGILTTMSPLAAKLGTSFFIVVRVLEGLGEVRHTAYLKSIGSGLENRN